jgi:hypothetical protein
MSELPPITACDCVDHLISYTATYDEHSTLGIYAQTEPRTGNVVVRAVRFFASPNPGKEPSRKYVMATVIPEEISDAFHRKSGLNGQRRLAVNVAIAIAAQIHRAPLCEMGESADVTPLSEFFTPESLIP